MGKLALFICLVFLVGSVISAVPASRSSSPSRVTSQACGRHGDSCAAVGGCCAGTRCNPYASRCMAIITAEDLQNARRNLRPVNRNRN